MPLVTGTTPTVPDDKTTIFPNPAGETITVRIPQNPQTATRIEVFSPTGVSVKKQVVSSATTRVPIQDLPAGLYVVVVYQKELPASVHKFIK